MQPPASGPERIDVAVSSYRKPESLIYTLLTLHRHSADRISKVWIGDDGSGEEVLAVLRDPALAERLAPWDIDIHVFRKRSGSGATLVTPGVARRMLSPGMPMRQRLRTAWFLAKAGLRDPEDIRYERGLARTTAAHLLVLHDDVDVRGDVAGFLQARMLADPRLAIAGRLGQCWRCGFRETCSPKLILSGGRPAPDWPLTPPPPGARWSRPDRACRINEWCCMIRVEAARALAAEAIHFGHCEDGGDTGAYWFAEAIARGWHFDDPFGRSDRWFIHGWQGHSGRSVWADQGQGKSRYDAGEIRARLIEDFGFTTLAMPPRDAA